MIRSDDEERVVIGVDALQLRDHPTDEAVGRLELEEVTLAGRERPSVIEPFGVVPETRKAGRVIVLPGRRVVPWLVREQEVHEVQARSRRRVDDLTKVAPTSSSCGCPATSKVGCADSRVGLAKSYQSRVLLATSVEKPVASAAVVRSLPQIDVGHRCARFSYTFMSYVWPSRVNRLCGYFVAAGSTCCSSGYVPLRMKGRRSP